MADISVSGTTNPYSITALTPQQNDKNTLSMTDFFQLIATQLQYQDPTSPMDNNELMAQMTQMAMMQSMNAMTASMNNSTAINTQTYAASLVGQEVTMAVTEENSYGQEVPVDVKYAKVEYVNFTTGDPTIKLVDDNKEYSLKHLVGMGRVPNPYAEDIETDQEEDKTEEPKDPDSEQGPGV